MKGNTKLKQDERLLTYAEVCDVLQTSQATLRRYVRDGRFPPPIKPNPNGRSVRFRYSDIAAWLSDL